MSLIKSMRRQKAVFWKNTGTDHYGSNTYDDPVEIKVRWDDQIGEFTGTRGETLATKAVVYVDRDMKPGDMLKLGELESGTPDDPTGDAAAFRVQAFEKNPDIKAKEFLRRAYL